MIHERLKTLVKSARFIIKTGLPEDRRTWAAESREAIVEEIEAIVHDLNEMLSEVTGSFDELDEAILEYETAQDEADAAQQELDDFDPEQLEDGEDPDDAESDLQNEQVRTEEAADDADGDVVAKMTDVLDALETLVDELSESETPEESLKVAEVSSDTSIPVVMVDGSGTEHVIAKEV